VIHVHGGNCFLGNGLQNEKLIHQITEDSDTVIFSPMYRLTPNVRAPEPQNDVVATVEYVYKFADLHGVDRNKIVLSGESAGGHLATGAALLLKQKQKNYIRCMVLFQPMLDDMIFSKPRKGATKGEAQMGLIIERSF